MERTTDDVRAAATVPALVARVAAAAQGAVALRYEGRDIGFGALDALGRRVARGLADLGVGPGDRVALWLPNLPAWFALFLGCARLGAIAVSVNTRFRSAEVEDILARSGAKALALWPGFRDIDFLAILDAVDGAALARLETVIVCGEDGAGRALPATVAGRRVVSYGDIEGRPPLDRDRSAPGRGCAIFTTSGTTRAPKFVLHDQAGIVAHGRAVARDFGFDAPDAVMLQALPLCGVFGFSQAMASLASGRPMVLMPTFEAAAAARLAAAERVTHLAATDDMIHRMLAERRPRCAFPASRLWGFASFSPALGDLAAEAERRGLRLVGLYGMSEVQALYARQRPEAAAAERGLAGGYPTSAEARVRVREPESGRLLGPGEQGELELAGPSRMAGYFGDEAATAAALTADGFVRTGDLGYLRGDGSFVFVARMGDALRLGGFLVSPAEIEAPIEAHPAVAGCQVVGVAGPAGIRAVAFVIPRPGAEFDEAALRAWCLDAMAKFKLPARFIPLDSFPVTRSANGIKIQRARLRQMAAAAMAETGSPAGRD